MTRINVMLEHRRTWIWVEINKGKVRCIKPSKFNWVKGHSWAIKHIPRALCFSPHIWNLLYGFDNYYCAYYESFTHEEQHTVMKRTSQNLPEQYCHMPLTNACVPGVTFSLIMFFSNKLSKEHLNLSIALPHRLEATWAASLSGSLSWPSIRTLGRSAPGGVELGRVQRGCTRNGSRQKQHRGNRLHQAALMSVACTFKTITIITIRSLPSSSTHF